nr:MAG TPA: hypothetical protein [Caudoviricetes sp.]
MSLTIANMCTVTCMALSVTVTISVLSRLTAYVSR